MVICDATMQWALFLLIGSALGITAFRMPIRVGQIAGGLGAVVFVLGLLGVGC